MRGVERGAHLVVRGRAPRQAVQEQQRRTVAPSALAVREADAGRRRPSSRLVRAHRGDLRDVVGPWHCFLQTGAEPDQDVLPAVPSDELDTSWQAVVRPPEGERDGGLAGDVDRAGERAAEAGHVRPQVVAERRRRPGRRRRDEDVVVVPPPQRAGAHPLHRVDHRQQLRCRHPSAVADHRPRPWLEVVVAERMADPVGPRRGLGGCAGGHRQPSRFPQLVARELRRCGHLDVMAHRLERVPRTSSAAAAHPGSTSAPLNAVVHSPIRSGSGGRASSSTSGPGQRRRRPPRRRRRDRIDERRGVPHRARHDTLGVHPDRWIDDVARRAPGRGSA